MIRHDMIVAPSADLGWFRESEKRHVLVYGLAYCMVCNFQKAFTILEKIEKQV